MALFLVHSVIYPLWPVIILLYISTLVSVSSVPFTWVRCYFSVFFPFHVPQAARKDVDHPPEPAAPKRGAPPSSTPTQPSPKRPRLDGPPPLAGPLNTSWVCIFRVICVTWIHVFSVHYSLWGVLGVGNVSGLIGLTYDLPSYNFRLVKHLDSHHQMVFRYWVCLLCLFAGRSTLYRRLGRLGPVARWGHSNRLCDTLVLQVDTSSVFSVG